jgi:hypothetical protein
LRYPRISLIRCALAVPAALGTRQFGRLCCHRVPFDEKAFANHPAKAELASMLPGFRFLFAAIVLSMSILVFGLGATALLRAAHEEFASTPAWHAGPETVFAPQAETTEPVLAMLRVAPPPAEEKAPDRLATAVEPAEQPATSAMPAEPEATVKPAEPEAGVTPAAPEATTTPAEPEQTAALPEDSSQPETVEPEMPVEMPVAESPPRQEAAPAQAEIPATADEPEMTTSAAAAEDVSAPASQAVPAAPEQASPPAAADAGIASTKIAMLGGPPVTIEASPPAKPTAAKPDKSVIKKRAEALRKARHRRLASQARVVQQLSQQPTDPFGRPLPVARRR